MNEFVNVTNYVTCGVTWLLAGYVIVTVLIKNKQLKAIIYLCVMYLLSSTALLGVTLSIKHKLRDLAITCLCVMLVMFGVIYWTFAIKYWNLYLQLRMLMMLRKT